MYTYYMSPGTKLSDHIDVFNKLILDLANIDIDIEDEDWALILLTSLPSSYENFMETLLYGRESLTMKDVLETMNSRELKKRTEGIKKEADDWLYVKEMSNHSESHLKRDCLKKKSSEFVKKGKRDQDYDSSNDEGNAYFGEALVVVENDEMTELVMDSCGSYHMTHRKDFLYDYQVVDGGLVQLEKVITFGVQKHGGLKQVGLKQLGSKQVGFKQLGHKQVGFKQLGPGVETGVHGVHDEKRVWFEVELQGAQGDREAEVLQMFIKSRIYLDDEYVVMTRNYFLQYTQLEIPEFRDTLIQHMESVKTSIDKRALHNREYDSWVSERQMHTTEEIVDTSKALDASLVDTESSETKSKEQDTNSRSGNDAHADDADIKPIYDEEPMVEVQTTTEINVFATGQQHTEQSEFHNKGEVDQNAKQFHDTYALPAKLTDN
uniref:Zinc finger, CCHC-type n=1 Tax=Tanacetum cinerariifolium TaxID=118510 RepID=A0A6L2MPR9_TANCI|nr:zinc finger, CCHC-type [Tanacetum cinerariifolium]